MSDSTGSTGRTGRVLPFPPQLRVVRDPTSTSDGTSDGTSDANGTAGQSDVPANPFTPLVATPLTREEREQAFRDTTAQLIARTGFVHDREPPTEWTDRLREISPPAQEHGVLGLLWEAGDPWVPGQRWTIAEMIGRRLIAREALAELEGPHPRSEGHMCSVKVPKQFQCLCRHKMEAWKGGPCQLVTLTQWKHYRKTGLLAVPYWVIQGNRGGHLHEFDGFQKELLRLKGLPEDPPRIGDLEYAPFDERVVAGVMREQKLARMGLELDELKRQGSAAYARQKADLARTLRAEFVKHLEEQLAPEMELFVNAAGEMEGERRTDFDFDRVGGDEGMQHFVETGTLMHPDHVK